MGRQATVVPVGTLCRALCCMSFLHCLISPWQQPCNLISSPSFCRRSSSGSETLNSSPRAMQKQADFGVSTRICLISNPSPFRNSTADIYRALARHQATHETSSSVIAFRDGEMGQKGKVSYLSHPAGRGKKCFLAVRSHELTSSSASTPTLRLSYLSSLGFGGERQ